MKILITLFSIFILNHAAPPAIFLSLAGFPQEKIIADGRAVKDCLKRNGLENEAHHMIHKTDIINGTDSELKVVACKMYSVFKLMQKGFAAEQTFLQRNKCKGKSDIAEYGLCIIKVHELKVLLDWNTGNPISLYNSKP